MVVIFEQPPIFWVETFFQLPPETFRLTLRTCSRYSKGTPNLVVYASNKIINARRTNQKILTNNKIMTWAETKNLIEISNPCKLSASWKWCPQSNQNIFTKKGPRNFIQSASGPFIDGLQNALSTIFVRHVNKKLSRFFVRGVP